MVLVSNAVVDPWLVVVPTVVCLVLGLSVITGALLVVESSVVVDLVVVEATVCAPVVLPVSIVVFVSTLSDVWVSLVVVDKVAITLVVVVNVPSVVDGSVLVSAEKVDSDEVEASDVD